MYLVDTSVWVDYIRGTETPAVGFLDELLSIPAAAGINDQIYLELLQGARDEAAFRKFQRYFSTPSRIHAEATKLLRPSICRRVNGA
jgi:predicted nucleic acid-binding protein